MRSAGTNARRLAGAGRGVDQGMKISEAMRPDDVFVGISVASKPRLLDFLAEKAAEVCGVARDDIWQALRAREELGSTGIGSGIAMPHAPVRGIATPLALLAVLAKPIGFAAVDGAPVDVVCLILTPPGDQNRHLKLLSRIARQLRDDEIVATIRRADRALAYQALTDSKD